MLRPLSLTTGVAEVLNPKPRARRAAVKVGAAAHRGTSWLYGKGKDLLSGNAATKPASAPPGSAPLPPASRPRY